MVELWQEVKDENINNAQFVLDPVCVKIRISVSVPSLFQACVGILIIKAKREPNNREKTFLIMRVEVLC